MDPKSPLSPLIKEPYIRIKIIEAKDVYLIQGSKKEMGDLYARITYSTQSSQKTQVISKTASPRWNKTFEFPYLGDQIDKEYNLIMISIYDSDPLGSDELVSTQCMPLSYFTDQKMHIKPIELWLQLNSVNTVDPGRKIVVETTENLYQSLDLPKFEEQIISTPEREKNSDIPKVHLILEIYDQLTIKHCRIAIVDVEEIKEGPLKVTVFIYHIKVFRNDGLEWAIKKRYSEIADFRDKLIKRDNDIKAIPFPEKDMLKFWSLVSTTSEKAYKNQGQERRKALEDFLNALVDIPYLYNFEEFDNFFTSYN